MKEKVINISREYTKTPGGRYRTLGEFSGEDFRETFLVPHFKNKNDNYPIIIELDGTEGYPTSFLEESFGGLARQFGKEKCLNRLRFISNEDKLLVQEINSYIKKVI